jgi:hypothetical protein
MSKTDHAEKGKIINIKDSLYIYLHKMQEKLIDNRNAKIKAPYLTFYIVHTDGKCC